MTYGNIYIRDYNYNLLPVHASRVRGDEWISIKAGHRPLRSVFAFFIAVLRYKQHPAS